MYFRLAPSVIGELPTYPENEISGPSNLAKDRSRVQFPAFAGLFLHYEKLGTYQKLLLMFSHGVT